MDICGDGIAVFSCEVSGETGKAYSPMRQRGADWKAWRESLSLCSVCKEGKGILFGKIWVCWPFCDQVKSISCFEYEFFFYMKVIHLNLLNFSKWLSVESYLTS